MTISNLFSFFFVQLIYKSDIRWWIWMGKRSCSPGDHPTLSSTGIWEYQVNACASSYLTKIMNCLHLQPVGLSWYSKATHITEFNRGQGSTSQSNCSTRAYFRRCCGFITVLWWNQTFTSDISWRTSCGWRWSQKGILHASSGWCCQ